MKDLLTEIRDYTRNALGHPKARRAFGAAAALLALDLLLAVLWWGPAAAQKHQFEKGIEDNRRAKLEALNIRDTTAQFEKLTQRINSLEARWNNPANQSGLIRSLTKLTRQCGLKVVSQDFDVVNSKGAGKSFKQHLSVSGTYPALRRFLSELDNLSSLTVAESTRMERAGEQGSQVRATLELCTYAKVSSQGGRHD